MSVEIAVYCLLTLSAHAHEGYSSRFAWYEGYETR